MRLLNPNLQYSEWVRMSKTSYYTNDICHLRQPSKRKQWVTIRRSRHQHQQQEGTCGPELVAASLDSRDWHHSAAVIHGTVHTIFLPQMRWSHSQYLVEALLKHMLPPELCWGQVLEKYQLACPNLCQGMLKVKCCRWWHANVQHHALIWFSLWQKFYWGNGS